MPGRVPLKWQFDRSRSKLKAAVEETQEVRRTAKDALSLQAEVTRLEKLLSEASIGPGQAQADLTGRQGEAPAARDPGASGEPEGHDQVAAHGTR